MIVTGDVKGIASVVTEAFLAAGAEVTGCGRCAPATLPSSGGLSAAFHPTDVRTGGDAPGRRRVRGLRDVGPHRSDPTAPTAPGFTGGRRHTHGADAKERDQAYE